MKDVEEVIAAYECSLDKWEKEECNNCPWGYGYIETSKFKFWNCDIGAILHDAVEILRSKDNTTHTYWVKETDRTNHWHCPKCGYVVGLANMWDNYCPKCGIRIARRDGE